MSSLNIENLARERRVAEADLRELEVATLRARRRVNMFAVINTLPVEVLAIIFRFLVVFDPPGRLARRILGWISASFVCSHWREVILSTPRLWSTPAFTISKRWAIEMLERAKEAPISIRLGGPQLRTSRWEFALVNNLFQTRMSSIHHISLFSERSRIETLCNILSKPAPRLQELVMSSATWDIEEGIPAILHTSLFSDSAPRLRQIILNSVFLPWQSNLFRNLERLSVKFPDPNFFLGVGDKTILERLTVAHPPGSSEDQLKQASDLAQHIFKSVQSGALLKPIHQYNHSAHASQSMKDLEDSTIEPDEIIPSASESLSILRHSPSLRALAFIRCIPSRRTFAANDTLTPVMLAELEEMSLGGHIQDCEALLNSIATPSLRSLDLACHFVSDSPYICWPIVSRVERFLSQPSAQLVLHPVSHVVVSTTGHGYGVKIVVQLAGMEDSKLVLVFQRQSSRVYWDRTILISHIFDVLPLHTATVLSLEANNDGADGLSFPDWIAFAPYLPCIQVIHLAVSCLERAWRVLHRPEFFPSLRAVVLCFRNLGEPVPSDIAADNQENFKHMQRVRSNAGCPPLDIVFSSGAPVPGL